MYNHNKQGARRAFSLSPKKEKMRRLILITLLAITSGLQAKSWTPSVQLERGDRVGVLDSVSGALIVYEVPSAGILQITDGNRLARSKMHYLTEYEPGGSRRTYIFQGALDAATNPSNLQSLADHKKLGTGVGGATLAGVATLTLSTSGAGTSTIALAEVVTAIGTVTLEFIPIVAVATGITLTVYYVHKGVTDWLDDVQGFPNGVRLFAEYVAKKWLYARAAVVFTVTAQLLMELEEMADEEFDSSLEEALKGLKNIEESLLGLEGMIEIQKALQELRESMEPRDPRNKSNWLRWVLKRSIQILGGIAVEEVALSQLEVPTMLEMLNVYNSEAGSRILVTERIQAAKEVSLSARLFWEAFETGSWSADASREAILENILPQQFGNAPMLRDNISEDDSFAVAWDVAGRIHTTINFLETQRQLVAMADNFYVAYKDGHCYLMPGTREDKIEEYRAVKISKTELADLLLKPETWISVKIFEEGATSYSNLLGSQGYRNIEDYSFVRDYYATDAERLLADLPTRTGATVLDVGAGINMALRDLQRIDSTIITIGTTVDPEPAIHPIDRQMFMPAEFLPEDLRENVDLVMCSISLRYHTLPYISIQNMIECLKPEGVLLFADGAFAQRNSPDIQQGFADLNAWLEVLVTEGYISIEVTSSVGFPALPIRPAYGGSYRIRKLRAGFPAK